MPTYPTTRTNPATGHGIRFSGIPTHQRAPDSIPPPGQPLTGTSASAHSQLTAYGFSECQLPGPTILETKKRRAFTLPSYGIAVQKTTNQNRHHRHHTRQAISLLL